MFSALHNLCGSKTFNIEIMNIWKSYMTWTAEWRIIWRKIIAAIYTTYSSLSCILSCLFNCDDLNSNILHSAVDIYDFYIFIIGEGKRRNEFAEWHVAWLAEWHNYAECKIWKMAQRNKLNWKTCARLCRTFYWRQLSEQQFCRSICYCWLKPTSRAKSSDKLYCILVYAIFS